MYRKTKKLFAVCLVVSMLLTMTVFSTVASAATSLKGTDRYQTALAVVKAGWTESENVVIARGDDLADALAAAPLAYAKGKAPILLTETSALPTGVMEELEALKVKNVYIVGGPGAVSAEVEAALAAKFTVKRLFGADRAATSLAVAKEAFTTAPAKAVLVNGYATADALSISSIAAYNGMPILLANSADEVSADVAAYLTGKTVYAVGGTGVLSAAVVGSATRLYGADRYATNVAVLKEFELDYSKVFVAIGEDANNVDALGGAAFAALGNNPMVLVEKALTPAAKALLAGEIAGDVDVYTLGGLVPASVAAAIEAMVPATLKVESVSATGAKKLTVTFNKAVTDYTKAAFAVKRGLVTVNVASVKFADDMKSAVLTLATKLTEGDYTVTVSGLTETALTSTVTGVLNEKATKIELLSDKAAAVLVGGQYTSATISYKVYNQYNEDITSSAPAITWNSTLGGSVTPSSGVLTIVPASGVNLMIGQTFNLTGVMTDPALVVSKLITVGVPAAVDSVTFDGLYNEDDEAIDTDFANDDFVVLFDAKDQYGNDLSAAFVNENTVVASTNPTIFTVASTNPVTGNNGEDSDQLGIALKKPTSNIDGTATLRMVSKSTGKVFEFTVTIPKAAQVDTFTMSLPDVTVAAGDTDVEIPFEAYNQYGDAVTSYSGLNGKVTFPSDGGGTVEFVNDYVNKKAVLYYDAPAAKGTYIIMALTPTGKTAQLTITVKEAEEAGYISGLDKNLVTNLVKNGTVDLDVDSFVIKDNYGRDYDITLGTASSGYTIAVDKSTESTAKTNISAGLITSAEETLTITGVAEGTSNYTAYLKEDGTKVAGSEFTFKVNVVSKDDIASYELKEIPKLYDNNDATTPSTHDADIVVYGLLENGSKVVIPASDFTVMTTKSTLTTPTASTLLADGYDFDDADVSEYTASVIVTVEAADDPVVLSQVVTISKAAPSYTTLSLKSSSSYYESAGVVTVSGTKNYSFLVGTVIPNVVKAVDQYGVEITSDTYNVVVTNLDSDTTLTAYKAGTLLTAGDTFNVTAITSNGKSIQFKVIVED